MLNKANNIEGFIAMDRRREKQFSHLDEEQLKAVFNEDRNVMVLACPGSGKTTVLIHKLLYLTLRKVNPRRIAVITFTKAAAANMKRRYEEIAKNQDMPFFGTFHGLCYKILVKHYGNINLIEGSQAYKVISACLTKYLEEVSEEKVKEVRNNISLFKNSGQSIDEYTPTIDKDIFINCFKEYENYKREKKLLDFDDLQANCKKLFISNEKVLEFYRKSFEYILIDEFQDCDATQIEIVKLLNKYNSIFCVGDEDQCIYTFRGSRPDYMVEFEKHFKNGRKLYLSTNYRSAENIVAGASELIKHNVQRNKKEMLPSRKDKKRFEILSSYNENEQAEDIALSIEKIKSIGNEKYGDNAVLYRTNLESRSLIDAFMRKKIPFRLLDKENNFFDHFICKDIASYLRLSVISDDIESFTRIINKPFRFVSRVNLDKLKENRYKENCFDVLKSMDSLPIYQVKSLDKLQKDISSLNKMSLQSAIEYVITELGYHDYLKEYSIKFKINIDELEEILKEFKEASNQYRSIIMYLAHIEQYGEELEKSSDKNIDEDRVILSTIHGSKGMEFKNVYIVNCVEECIPHLSSLETSIEEERRLFYVGVTRAINNLFIYIPRNMRGKLREPSRFIEEVNMKVVENLGDIYKLHEEIIHSTFGKGSIVNINKGTVEIRFDDKLSRTFDLEVLHNKGIIRKIH